MQWLHRLISDAFVITAFAALSLSSFIWFATRRAECADRSWLYHALFFASVGFFVYLDNALGEFFNREEAALNWRIPAEIFCLYAAVAFGALALAETHSLDARRRRPLAIGLSVLSLAPLASACTLVLGWRWYRGVLAVPVVAAFTVAFLALVSYVCVLVGLKRAARGARPMISLLTVSAIGLYLVSVKVACELFPRFYLSQSYFPLLFVLALFASFLSAQAVTERRELRAVVARGTEPGSFDLGAVARFVASGSLPFPATDRERAVIRGLCEGLLYKEISSETGLSLSLVKKTAHEVYRKAGVQTRVDLIKLLASQLAG